MARSQGPLQAGIDHKNEAFQDLLVAWLVVCRLDRSSELT